MTEQNDSTTTGQLTADPLCTPWSLHFDRDGTEDYGIICDAEGNDLVASHITGSKTPPRWKDREFGEGCFWLPENEGDEVPLLVRQMQVMTAAPKLLAMLKIAVATADPDKHKWVKEAREAIAEATGTQPQAAPASEEPPHLYRLAPHLYAHLKVCTALLDDYASLVKAVDTLFKPQGELASQIEDIRRQALMALVETDGGITF